MFSVFLGKIILSSKPIFMAKAHLLLQHEKVVKVSENTDTGPIICETAAKATGQADVSQLIEP